MGKSVTTNRNNQKHLGVMVVRSARFTRKNCGSPFQIIRVNILRQLNLMTQKRREINYPCGIYNLAFSQPAVFESLETLATLSQ